MNKKPFTFIDKIPLYLKRDNVDSLVFEIETNSFTLTVPFSMPNREVSLFIDEKKDDFIKRHKALLEKLNQSENDFNPRKMKYILFLGHKVPIEFRRTSKMSFTGKSFVLPELIQLHSPIIIEDNLTFLLRELLRGQIEEELKIWEKKTGLHCNGFSIRKMKTRWSSTTTNTAKMRYNFYLVTQPLELIGYVVLCSLISLKYKSGSKEFKELLHKYMPDYKKYQEELKKLNSKIQYIY